MEAFNKTLIVENSKLQTSRETIGLYPGSTVSPAQKATKLFICAF